MRSMYIVLGLCLFGLVLLCGCSADISTKASAPQDEGDISPGDEGTDESGTVFYTGWGPSQTEGWAGGIYVKFDEQGDQMVAFSGDGPAYIEDVEEDDYYWVTMSDYELWLESASSEDEDDESGYIDKASSGGGYTVTEDGNCRLDTKTGEIICDDGTTASELPPGRMESQSGGEPEGTPVTTSMPSATQTTTTTPATMVPTTPPTTPPPTTTAPTTQATAAATATPQDAYSWFTLGMDFYSQGDYESAVDAFDEAILLDSGQKSVWYNKALALVQLGRYQEAIDSAEEAVRIDPAYSSGWVAKGLAESRLGQYPDSVESYNTALVLNPGDYKTWNNLGVIYYNMGLYAEAVDAYDNALAIKPDYSTAQQNRDKAIAKL